MSGSVDDVRGEERASVISPGGVRREKLPELDGELAVLPYGDVIERPLVHGISECCMDK
jgi:hypothetical protein